MLAKRGGWGHDWRSTIENADAQPRPEDDPASREIDASSQGRSGTQHRDGPSPVGILNQLTLLRGKACSAASLMRMLGQHPIGFSWR